MSNSDELPSRQWSEWDRETLRTEMSLEGDDKKLLITARVQDQEVGRLQGDVNGRTIVVREFSIPKEIKITRKKGFFAKPASVPGRDRGYGTLLVRALLAHARRHECEEIIGGLSAEDLRENRYALEWYSRRGFITERTPAPGIADSVATFRFLI